MGANTEIAINRMAEEDIMDTLLQDFNRYQKTTHVFVQDGEEITVMKDEFIDDWDEGKKQKISADLRRTAAAGGAVIGARRAGMLIGFAVLEPERFGKKDVYLELSYIHVSRELRGQGLGKKLFQKSLQTAKEMGATKLYIGAHPSVDTQKFYQEMGCVLAKEINQKIYQREPRDLQLEIPTKEA
ncbi:GNAT family N-acetyltransferase [Sutcliffiella deserti]|uniref:GNAT family N-acetyltransferase n=1 Tax=Sutcliffiella deserti TaxID=2875501 RepID=UPI001CBD133B|nr:GNAT family N-acetyltransferase [Sutcliffiella deserti]